MVPAPLKQVYAVAQQGKGRLQVRLNATYRRHERYVPALTFLAGTLFDVVMLNRIDETKAIVQLGVDLLIVGAVLAVEAIDEVRPVTRPRLLLRVWKYREEVAHFFLGCLLSAFTVLYFKSASLWPSLLFFLLIAGLLVGNEFSALRRLGLSLRTGLFAVCLTSYLACITPLWWGRLGWLPFLTALGISLAICIALLSCLMRRVPEAREVAGRLALPYLGTLAAFFFFYALHWIPPVPLALTHIGIYHNVERTGAKGGGYRVSFEKQPWWHLGEHGDQNFKARAGDRIFCFFSVFSPGGFHDSVRVHWFRWSPGMGWQGSDAVPVSISGGRDAGFRGFAYKANFQAGDWQVRIETSDGREVGRISLNVVPVPPGESLEVLTEAI